MNFVLKRTAFVFLSIFLCGCAGKRESEEVVRKHFNAISTKRYSVAVNDYADKKSEWLSLFNEVQEKLGDLKGYKIRNFRYRGKSSSEGSEARVEIVCRTKYTKASAEERFTLVKSSKSPEFKIIGHEIKSKNISFKRVE